VEHDACRGAPCAYVVEKSISIETFDAHVEYIAWTSLPYPFPLLAKGVEESLDNEMKCLRVWLVGTLDMLGMDNGK